MRNAFCFIDIRKKIIHVQCCFVTDMVLQYTQTIFSVFIWLFCDNVTPYTMQKCLGVPPLNMRFS